MQHGALTPLGRQLRSVLLSIRSKPAPDGATTPYQHNFLPSNSSSRPRYLQHSIRHYGIAAAALAEAIPVWPEEAQKLREEPLLEKRTVSSLRSRSRRWYRQIRYDRITEALKVTQHRHALLGRRSARKMDLSHVNIRKRGALGKSGSNARKHIKNPQPLPETGERLELVALLAKHIRHTSAVQGGADPSSTFFSQRENEYLESRGYSLDDIHEWAGIITAASSYEAATRLLESITSRSRWPPVSLLLHLLRRPYLSASTLRQLIRATHHIVEQHASNKEAPHIPENAIMTLFVRLVRHAREVWPSALDDIAAWLVRSLSANRVNQETASLDQKSRLTYSCNTAMHLLSLPTAAQPFKDAAMQEAAIVRVLSFMSEHQPPLQIDRQGYRAVVRVQIAQNKTHPEQEWAELKALSWPPWKQERTAIDADITAENHGTSRASNTLQRMREAGYRADTWMKAAQLYSGWDIDGTPTVQTRALMGSSMEPYRSEHPIWAARIATTRTAQEAWAAYLAYEETGLGPNSQVIFAIVQKLSKEEERCRAQDETSTLKRNPPYRPRLFPGDRREVDPLPPSVHLYTYTRTPIPSVETFFRELQERGVYVDAHTLALMVENATSLQLGIWYLRVGSRGQDNIRTLLLLERTQQQSPIPSPLFSAFINLLCRYPSVHMSKVISGQTELSNVLLGQPLFLDGHELNLLHPTVHAFRLLRRFRPTSAAPWTDILRTMSKTVTLTSMRFFFKSHKCRPSGEDPAGLFTRAKCAMVASSFVNHILSAMRDIELEIDESQLHYVCLAVENMAVACWRLTKYQIKESSEQHPHLATFKADTIRDANQAIDNAPDTAQRTKDLFLNMVGSAERHSASSSTASEELALPQLLHCPSPVLLHAYIRALGWLGDHNGLLELTRWMVTHQHELQEQRKRHRNAEDLMKLSVRALRVFLERSWLAKGINDAAAVSAGQRTDAAVQGGQDALERLESPAPAEIVKQVQELLENVEDWPSWPDEDEVTDYCRHEKFRELRKLYVE